MIINRFALSEKAQFLPWAHKLSEAWSCKFEPSKSPDHSRTFVFTHIIRQERARKLIRSGNVNLANRGSPRADSGCPRWRAQFPRGPLGRTVATGKSLTRAGWRAGPLQQSPSRYTVPCAELTRFTVGETSWSQVVPQGAEPEDPVWAQETHGAGQAGLQSGPECGSRQLFCPALDSYSVNFILLNTFPSWRVPIT